MPAFFFDALFLLTNPRDPVQAVNPLNCQLVIEKVQFLRTGFCITVSPIYKEGSLLLGAELVRGLLRRIAHDSSDACNTCTAQWP